MFKLKANKRCESCLSQQSQYTVKISTDVSELFESIMGGKLKFMVLKFPRNRKTFVQTGLFTL